MEMETRLDEPYSFYDHVKANDVITILKPLLDSKSYVLRHGDGKFKVKGLHASSTTPWIHVKHTPGFNCHLWHHIIFDVVCVQLPKDQQFVPRHCQGCWKVVVKPRTLQQLFNLLEMQKALDLPAKAGIEVRESVHGLYGGYFYNRSHGEGMACYDHVKKAIRKNELLSPLVDEVDGDGRTTRVILKRGCTEFEHLIGDSDKWEVTKEQESIEDMVERFIVDENLDLTQQEHLVWNVKRRWIEWAWQNGDSTYVRYTGGKPLYPAYVTYHQPEKILPERDEILFRKF